MAPGEERKAQVGTGLDAEGMEAWLLALREHVVEVEEDSEEAYFARRQLVRLLVDGIMVGRREDRQADIKITYRFGPPPAGEDGEVVGAGVGFVPAGKNGKP